MIQMRALTHEDIDTLDALVLRPEDVRELETATGLSWVDALFDAITATELPLTMVGPEGQILVVCGLSRPPGKYNMGIPWAVATVDMQDHAISCTKLGQVLVRGWRTKVERLVNFVDERNVSHVRWLRMLGFEFPNISAIKGNQRFLCFEMKGLKF